MLEKLTNELPPLNALRAFEAVARLGGVQRARIELRVTHGAISRHLKVLEDWLGGALFDRSQRSLRLSPEGATYYQKISAAMNLILEGTHSLKKQASPNSLRISTFHSFAAKWLMPRLPDFSRTHPKIEVWVTVEQKRTNFSRDGVDLALRVGPGPWPDHEQVPVMNDRLIVVCSPTLVNRDKIKRPSDLKSFTLLHDQDPNTQWKRWAETVGLNASDFTKGPRFGSADLLLRAAISGQGIALVNEVLAAEDLKQGYLVSPLPQSVELGTNYWLVMPKESALLPRVCAFRDWLSTQVD